jgi:hypothetical protein
MPLYRRTERVEQLGVVSTAVTPLTFSRTPNMHMLYCTVFRHMVLQDIVAAAHCPTVFTIDKTSQHLRSTGTFSNSCYQTSPAQLPSLSAVLLVRPHSALLCPRPALPASHAGCCCGLPGVVMRPCSLNCQHTNALPGSSACPLKFAR